MGEDKGRGQKSCVSLAAPRLISFEHSGWWLQPQERIYNVEVKKRSSSCKALPVLSFSFLLYFCLRRDHHFHKDTISPIRREHLCHSIRCREKERQTRTFLMPLGEGQCLKGSVGIEIVAHNGEVWNRPQSDHWEECREQCSSHINKDLNEARKEDLSGADIDRLSMSVPPWECCNVNQTAVKTIRTPCCTFCSSHFYTIRQWFSNFLYRVPPQKTFGSPSTTIMTNIVA